MKHKGKNIVFKADRLKPQLNKMLEVMLQNLFMKIEEQLDVQKLVCLLPNHLYLLYVNIHNYA